MAVSAVFKFEVGIWLLFFCAIENENLLALRENKNPDTSLIWSMNSAAQIKNKEKVVNIILLWP